MSRVSRLHVSSGQGSIRGGGSEKGGGLAGTPPLLQGSPYGPRRRLAKKCFLLQSSWHRRRRSKILAVSLKHRKGRGGRGRGCTPLLLRCTAALMHRWQWNTPFVEYTCHRPCFAPCGLWREVTRASSPLNECVPQESGAVRWLCYSLHSVRVDVVLVGDVHRMQSVVQQVYAVPGHGGCMVFWAVEHIPHLLRGMCPPGPIGCDPPPQTKPFGGGIMSPRKRRKAKGGTSPQGLGGDTRTTPATGPFTCKHHAACPRGPGHYGRGGSPGNPPLPP